MKNLVTLVGVALAALALAAVAWAATPEGKLTGEIKWNNPGSRPFEGVGTNGIHVITTDAGQGGTPIKDGQTDPLFINVNNDRSGNCTGDSGNIVVQYVDAGVGSAVYPIICAHYSNDVTMSYDFFDTHYQKYLVVNVVYKGASADPIVRFGVETDATRAMQWVNLGTAGSGHTAMSVANSTKKGDVVVSQAQ